MTPSASVVLFDQYFVNINMAGSRGPRGFQPLTWLQDKGGEGEKEERKRKKKRGAKEGKEKKMNVKNNNEYKNSILALH